MPPPPTIDPLEPVLPAGSDAAAVPVLPAATIMVVRDGEVADPRTGATLEVCLLQRNLRSTWVGGVQVFPGGAVDPGDGDAEIAARCEGRADAEIEAAGGLAFWVAAVRETFEEAGLLLARHGAAGLHQAAGSGVPDDHLRLDHPAVVERFAEHRRAVDTAARSLGAVLAEEDLRLDLSDLHYVARWVTPLGLTRRYDTRFFLAIAPPHQSIGHDGRETIAAHWHRPGEALAQHRAGDLVMRIPTVASLQWLADASNAAEALAMAEAIDDVPVITGTSRVAGDVAAEGSVDGLEGGTGARQADPGTNR